ncbi:MAG: cytochrome c oxidase subunit II [Myxococcota bacterium]
MTLQLLDIPTAGPLLASAEGSFWMPPQASNFAGDIDPLFYFILWLSIFFFVLLMGATAYFMWKYRQRSPDQKTSPVKHNGKLEFLWSAVPTVLLVVIFAWGQDAFVRMESAPSDSIDVRVTGQKWQWTVEYPMLGKSCTDKMVVPVDTPVKVTLTSTDVIHSLFIPAFRVKRDAVPNRYTGYWFEATETGEYDMFCTEYCGQQHSEMTGKVKVVSDVEWRAWLASNDCPAMDTDDPMKYGEQLYVQNCKACHTLDGSELVGPTFKGLYGKEESLADGSTVTVDDNYLRESITKPNAKVVSGFAPSMPSFAAQLDDKAINALITYIKAQGDGAEAEGQ